MVRNDGKNRFFKGRLNWLPETPWLESLATKGLWASPNAWVVDCLKSRVCRLLSHEPCPSPWCHEEDAVVLDLLTGAEDLLRLDCCRPAADHVP